MLARLRIFTILGVLSLFSCGSESDGVINNPGTGSGTLFVDITITGKEQFSGASNPENFTTDIVVKVKDSSLAPVQDAKVVVNAGGMDIIIPHDKNEQYKATQIVGYTRVYKINISRGSDYISDLTITGPEIHSIKIGNPQDTVTTVKASDPVNVIWSPYGYATSVDIETRNFTTTTADTGSYNIPAGRFEPGVDDYIRVTREKSMNPTGGVGGSVVRVRLRNRLDPIIVK